jgi:hypothetical protein
MVPSGPTSVALTEKTLPAGTARLPCGTYPTVTVLLKPDVVFRR